MKYLLSDGTLTEIREEYITDLFRLALCVYPKDIPGLLDFGFDFLITDTFKSDLGQEVYGRVSRLAETIKKSQPGNLEISILSCDLIDEKLAKVVIKVNDYVSNEINIEL